MAQEIEFSKLAREMETDIRKAQKKAGRRVGAKMKRARVKGLKTASNGTLSSRRKKAVRSIVGKNGVFTFSDWAPMARAQEFGEVIRGKGRDLFVQDRRRQDTSRPTFIRNGMVFEAPKIKGQKPRFVGVFKDKVRIRRLPRSARMTTIAEAHIDEYLDAVTEEMGKL